MSQKIIRTVLLITLMACAPMVQAAESCEGIRDLRIGLTPGRTRVVFDLSGPVSYQLQVLESPARVVVDISACTSQFNPNNTPLQGTPITRIRSNIRPDGALRFVFDVTQETNPKLLALGPHMSRGHRLALDLHTPGGSSAKLAAGPGSQYNPDLDSAQPATDPSPPAETPHRATTEPNPVANGHSGEWSGYISLEPRIFFSSPAFSEQDRQNISSAFEPEYYYDWANGTQRFAFRPFFRYDANDDARSHIDIRELYWRIERDPLIFKAGMDVVFWGVTESQHLVDIINQTDLVENIDGEDKLGQPMLNLDYLGDWGTWQLYVLPYFRERTFPGKRGRLRTQPRVNDNKAIYESGDEENHIDFALRWSHYIGDWDIGLAHFSGTSREPVLIPSDAGREPRLVPVYLQIDQTSLDVQATKGAWLWKLEAIYNQNKVNDYYAYVGGFEYTHFGVAGTQVDLGLLLEYNYDDRDRGPVTALQSTEALQDDIYAGLRITGNDIADTSFLAGVIIDTDNQSTVGNIEAVRRLGESWTIAVEARFFTNIDKEDEFYFFKEDDYIELQLTRFF